MHFSSLLQELVAPALPTTFSQELIVYTRQLKALHCLLRDISKNTKAIQQVKPKSSLGVTRLEDTYVVSALSRSCVMAGPLSASLHHTDWSLYANCSK